MSLSPSRRFAPMDRALPAALAAAYAVALRPVSAGDLHPRGSCAASGRWTPPGRVLSPGTGWACCGGSGRRRPGCPPRGIRPHAVPRYDAADGCRGSRARRVLRARYRGRVARTVGRASSGPTPGTAPRPSSLRTRFMAGSLPRRRARGLRHLSQWRQARRRAAAADDGQARNSADYPRPATGPAAWWPASSSLVGDLPHWPARASMGISQAASPAERAGPQQSRRRPKRSRPDQGDADHATARPRYRP